MKKLIPLLTFGMMTWAGTAIAIPFQITGSTLSTSVGVSYEDYAMGSPVDLDTGESFIFTFGKVTVPHITDEGSASLAISFAAPTTGGVGDTGWLETFAFFLVGGSIDFGAPKQFSYSSGGNSGGLLALDMFDVGSFGVLGTSFKLKGKITNLRSPTTAVPEPSALLLLGAGLLGLGLARRKPAM